MKFVRSSRTYALLWIVLVAVPLLCLSYRDCSLLTADQKAYRRYVAGEHEAAAAAFVDPMWRGVALYRKGEFELAAGIFAGFDTAEAAFNQGNALVMQGKYDAAVARYDRALELRPGWESALVNRDIAAKRGALLERKGGDMTGGMLGADDIVVSNRKSDPSVGSEPVEGGGGMSEEELRAIWLRQVQTKPAEFLRAKFAYQLARREASEGGDE